MTDSARGPLTDVRVIEIGGIGPAPFGATMLADLGAEVIRVARPSEVRPRKPEHVSAQVLTRGRRSVAVDLKQPSGREIVLRLVEHADVLIEPFRPGVMARLGLGADECLARNQRLVYAHMSGWGQDGPLAQAAGHDINFIALAGALDGVGQRGGKPTVPLNLVGDFGGGGMLLAFGIVSALLEARRSGLGQEIDVAMVDGAAALMGVFYGRHDDPSYASPRGTNLLDGGAWFYNTYETADHQYISFGAIEPAFCAQLLDELGLEPQLLDDQLDAQQWAGITERVAAVVATKTRAEWVEQLEGGDTCFAPVLSIHDAPHHPHNVHRNTFVEIEGVVQPAPAPRFARTPGAVQRPPAAPGQHTAEVLRDWLGADDAQLGAWRDTAAIAGVVA